QNPSRARDLPGRFQYAALGVRDFTIGLSRWTPVPAAPSRGSWLDKGRVRAPSARYRRPPLSRSSASSPGSARGLDARAQPDVGEEPGGVRPAQGGRTQRQGGGRGARSDGGRGAAAGSSSVYTAQDRAELGRMGGVRR